MIQFFRKIRQNMIQDNKVSKYLLYALGEIVLVVIGILIALQINNWNEGRKAGIQEANFFADLMGDLEKDEAKLDYLDHFHLKRIEYLDTLLTYVRNPKITMGIEKFGMYVEPLYRIDVASNYNTTFESAKTSGAFNNFKSKELIRDLTQYYSDFSNLESVITSIRAIVENQFEPLLYTIPESYLNGKTGSLVISEGNVTDFFRKVGAIQDHRNLIIDYDKILQDPRFESYLIGDMGRTFDVMDKIRTRKQNILQIKAKLLSIE
ncbi:MAG: hypothetical protein E4H26_04885 [Flavobacteriales bacterium]|nr:MAG: hypothetical protein E4H26_04885 [Flavobacteriales bacterium]